jgi:large subunit ribosomal protein L3
MATAVEGTVPGILGRKVGMTQFYDDKGDAVPCTLIELGPCTITQVKTEEKDGYAAIQIGFEERKPKRVTKPEMGHFRKAGVKPQVEIREIRVADVSGFELGQQLDVGQFEVGQRVDVVGTSIGRGFQGVVKRHGFSGGKATHGVTTHDQPGSIGQSAYPARVLKGTKLPGRMGNARVTMKNLEVMVVDTEQNLMVVRGSIPGARRSLVLVRPVAGNKKG